jgi:hypothetical protein
LRRAAIAGGVALAAAALAGAPACTSFEDPTTVIDLRALAVQVEPSEIILSVDLTDPRNPTVDPANNPPLMVTPLVADPKGDNRELTYTILACPNDPFAAAPPGASQGGGPFPSGGARTTVGSALCDETSPNTWTLMDATPVPAGPPPTFTIQPTVDQLRAAFMADIFPDQFGNLHGGFDLGMPFTLDLKIAAANGEEIRTIKRALYWAVPVSDMQTPNQNPVMDSVVSYAARDPDTLEPIYGVTTPVEAGVALPVPAGSKLWLEPARAVAEPYWTTVIDPDTHQAKAIRVDQETVRYRFFATAGSFSPAQTSSEPLPGVMVITEVHIESEYSAPADISGIPADAMGRRLVTVWIVARDDRGGTAWLERQLEIY